MKRGFLDVIPDSGNTDIKRLKRYNTPREPHTPPVRVFRPVRTHRQGINVITPSLRRRETLERQQQRRVEFGRTRRNLVTEFDMVVRRSTRKKRRGVAGKRRTYQTRSSADETLAKRYLSVYRDPFSMASNTPRIPDGKEMYSIGLRHRQRHEMTYTTGEIEVFLFPGLNNGLIIRGCCIQ